MKPTKRETSQTTVEKLMSPNIIRPVVGYITRDFEIGEAGMGNGELGTGFSDV